ncbi:L-aspartate oxidase [Bacillus niameyensis]|uniref:L-aspartate oxidase n=1 Tax=Bacillus niameyensis TaxID=1522308 RepID=UPI000784827F|nr:L-aspartate oxidase [Bacillus niameyensis]
MKDDDVVIVGSGVAALRLATLLRDDLNVRILTKSRMENANSYLAQGGIAAAVAIEDDPIKHFADTLEAGRYHHHHSGLVREILNEAPELIQEISTDGDIFDKDARGNLVLGLEGAHREKRIVHSGGDATGKNLIEYLIHSLRDHVEVEENIFAYELIVDEKENRCIGVKAKNQDGVIRHFYGNYIVLATGGCGQLYSFTSNAETVTGDGIAMAYLAGAEIADMEFIQFHPTLLYKDGKVRGLISEAVRGEGAILVTEDGTPIMEGVHPLKDLAPRHIVSQAIFDYREKGHEIYLDIDCISNFERRFPSITEICQKNGVNLAEGRIPVISGSHFLMGGIKTDGIGRSSLKGLFAIGEASCTGFHGANRLASNSLLEGLYQGKKLSRWINSHEKLGAFPRHALQAVEEKTIQLPDISLLKETMMKKVGIVRSKELLSEQMEWLDQLDVINFTILDVYSIQDLTMIFMYINAYLITEAALKRTESRGGHFRSDFPNEDEYWRKKVIIQNREGGVVIDEQTETEEVNGAVFY